MGLWLFQPASTVGNFSSKFKWLSKDLREKLSVNEHCAVDDASSTEHLIYGNCNGT